MSEDTKEYTRLHVKKTVRDRLRKVAADRGKAMGDGLIWLIEQEEKRIEAEELESRQTRQQPE